MRVLLQCHWERYLFLLWPGIYLLRLAPGVDFVISLYFVVGVSACHSLPQSRYYALFLLSWRDRKCGSVAIHLAKTECNLMSCDFWQTWTHVCTASCQVFLNEGRVCCEGFFTALPSLTQTFVRCIGVDLDLFVIIPMLLFVFLFAECPCSPGKRRELRLKIW